MVERKNDKKAMVHKQYKMIKILATRTPLKTELKGKTTKMQWFTSSTK
jgi:hypothetical protein